CLRLQSSARNKRASAIRGDAGALEVVSEVEQCHDNFANLRTAHKAQMRKPHKVLTKSDFPSCPGAPRGMQAGEEGKRCLCAPWTDVKNDAVRVSILNEHPEQEEDLKQ
ncbi:hypothetical protein LEMLEM_LOCUS22169, partial [Lemmus lemmus]